MNSKNCYFMVTKGIVLGHLVSNRGIEVDKANTELTEKLHPPTIVKDVTSFLGETGFYRRFILDFSKIAKPLTDLLIKDVPFDFTHECEEAFNKLKTVQGTVMQASYWDLPFEIMCDASDYDVGAVLGQRKDKKLHAICYTSKTLDKAIKKKKLHYH